MRWILIDSHRERLGYGRPIPYLVVPSTQFTFEYLCGFPLTSVLACGVAASQDPEDVNVAAGGR